MQREFDSLMQHGVGTLVDPPAGANVLGGMWIFNRKRDEHHRIIKYKARWVVLGNHQIKGLDYEDTYASVGKIDSLRILLALSVSNTSTRRWKIRQFNIVTAFLNGDMKDRVYAKQPTGFEHPTQPGRVWLLIKSLYGTKQAARRWQQHFGATASEFKLLPVESDSAVYFLQDPLGMLVIHLHVDDSLVFCNNDELFDKFKAFIDSKYSLKWTMSPTLYLGIKLDISADGSLVRISQSHYIESTLERFGMLNCKAAKAPLPQKLVLAPGSAEDIEEAKNIPYQELTGCLQWISVCTRPDISYAVSQLARYNSCWTLAHWHAAKHVLRYLQGTKDLTISYSGGSPSPQAYSDSDFSQCPVTQKSITGFVVVVADGAVSWKSQRQPIVALSTSEAEYVAATECAKHISWVRSFYFDVLQQLLAPTTLHIDNTSAIFTASGEGIKSRSKHID